MRFFLPAVARDPHEDHRAATPLELFFDLVSVIAIASAAAGLHHAISADHLLEGLVHFGMMFFAVWWAWMNYTWYASAYDNDDVFFRLMTFVVISGALTMAAGVPLVFDGLDLRIAVIGYIIMRVGMVVLWTRAARNDPERRTTSIRYAVGISLAQVYWTALIFLPLSESSLYALFVIGMVLELSVPAFAERPNPTPWHRHHIIERYGLLTIIVLGEILLSASMALGVAFESGFDWQLISLAISALIIVVSMWWLYFSREEHLGTTRLHHALQWGYGHFVVFGAGAAVGAGFGVAIDVLTDHADVNFLTATYAVAFPVALYILGLWFVRDRFCLNGAAKTVLPIFAVLILIAPPLIGLPGVAVLTVLSAIARNMLSAQTSNAEVHASRAGH